MVANAMRDSQTPEWAITAEDAAETTSRFIARVVAEADTTGVVVGLSGGIDSAVATALAVRGLGPDRVLGLLMPYATSAPSSLNDARTVADFTGIRTELMDISQLVNAWRHSHPGADRIRQGNVMARARMILLYDVSARDDLLVLGTGHRSASLLGYTTIYGDSACALNPLGKLYKTEIRILAVYLGLPAAVIRKPPSADLWVGQADEDELGFTYSEVDRILHHMIDEGLGDRQLATLGFNPELVQEVRDRVRTSAFKRHLPPVAEFPNRPDPTGGPAERGSA
jgi:NAD+ synthase